MGDVINLNRERKARAKQTLQKQAEENRQRHGRSKSEKQATRDDAEKQSRTLDGHVLTFSDDETKLSSPEKGDGDQTNSD